MLIVNGKALEAGSPETTLLNRAFKFGDGLFEEIRIYKGKALFVEAHVQRLMEGMDCLKFVYDKAAWSKEIRSTLARSIELNQIEKNGRIRLHVYRSGTGAFAPLSHQPFYLLEAYALKDNYFESQVQTSLVDYKEAFLAPGVLSRFYASNSLPITLSAIHARSEGFEEAVLFGPEGISMTSTGNIFVVKQKKLFTPGLDSACVDGIMRAQILSLCKGLKIPVQEKKLKPRDLEKADEIFVCNSLRGIVPVRQYNDRDFHASAYVLTPFLRQCLQQLIEDISR